MPIPRTSPLGYGPVVLNHSDKELSFSAALLGDAVMTEQTKIIDGKKVTIRSVPKPGVA